MKKTLLKVLSILLAVSMICLSTTEISAATKSTKKTSKAKVEKEFRGEWFSFRDWQALLQGKDEAGFRAAFDTVCTNTVSNGIDVIFVHVRSHNDAVYPSAIYPWSTEMLNGDPGFDPLAIMVDTAHRYNLKIHAWINPYGYRNDEYCGDASLATYENIIAGINEILYGYDVDGIHFDDYFPPLGADVHNALVKDVYNTVHAYGKVFGISPSGNIDNNIANGVDVVTWLSQKGYVDYICPQLYWTDNYGKSANVTMFSDRLAAWNRLNKAGIPMYIGLAAYRAGTGVSSDPGWAMSDSNLASQVKKLRNAGCKGFILYSYSSTISNEASDEMENLRIALQ